MNTITEAGGNKMQTKDKTDRLTDILGKVCAYSLITAISAVIYMKTGEAEAYGAQLMAIILSGFVFFIVTLNYRKPKG